MRDLFRVYLMTKWNLKDLTDSEKNLKPERIPKIYARHYPSGMKKA